MLTRLSAEGAAAAVAAVVASAVSVASEAARGLDRRRRAGQYTRERNGVLHRSHRIVSRFRPLLLKLARMAPMRVGRRTRVCASQKDTDPRASYGPSLAWPRTQRRLRRRRPRQRQPRHPRQMSASALRNLKNPPLGRTLGPPERLWRSNSFSYLYGGAVVARRATTEV